MSLHRVNVSSKLSQYCTRVDWCLNVLTVDCPEHHVSLTLDTLSNGNVNAHVSWEHATRSTRVDDCCNFPDDFNRIQVETMFFFNVADAMHVLDRNDEHPVTMPEFTNYSSVTIPVKNSPTFLELFQLWLKPSRLSSRILLTFPTVTSPVAMPCSLWLDLFDTVSLMVSITSINSTRFSEPLGMFFEWFSKLTEISWFLTDRQLFNSGCCLSLIVRCPVWWKPLPDLLPLATSDQQSSFVSIRQVEVHRTQITGKSSTVFLMFITGHALLVKIIHLLAIIVRSSATLPWGFRSTLLALSPYFQQLLQLPSNTVLTEPLSLLFCLPPSPFVHFAAPPSGLCSLSPNGLRATVVARISSFETCSFVVPGRHNPSREAQSSVDSPINTGSAISLRSAPDVLSVVFVIPVRMLLLISSGSCSAGSFPISEFLVAKRAWRGVVCLLPAGRGGVSTLPKLPGCYCLQCSGSGRAPRRRKKCAVKKSLLTDV